MNKNVVFLSVDHKLFPQAVFTAKTVRDYANTLNFDIVIAVPKGSLEQDLIDWSKGVTDAILVEFDTMRDIGEMKTGNYLPISTCYRYLFHLYLPKTYDRVVYLDADIRVNGDISRLFELDLGNFPFAARPGLTVAHNAEPGTWRRRYLEMMNWDETVPYGSAGVLIINPSKWLEMDLGSRVIEFVRDNQEICKLADETALNMQVRGQFVPISPIWNMITSLWLSEELNDLLDPIVLHHGGAQKPWSPMKWYTVTGDVEESKIYDSFFSETDCPVPVSEAISWKDRKRYFRRVVQHRLLGQKIDRRDLNLKKFRDHIQNFEFSDIEQGLTSFNDAGLLTLVHRC